MKKIKNIAIIILFLAISLGSMTCYASDNADTGTGDTNDAWGGKGYYRTSEYMYKVSVYVGLSDQTNTNSNLETEWKMIGSKALYVKPPHFSMPSNVFYGNESKVNYLNGSALVPNDNLLVIVDNPPPVPITNWGNITSVRSYFGDTETLNYFIDAFAAQKGTSKVGLVEDMYFTIEGERRRYPAEEILPIKINNKYQNKVPWLVVYEPVIIAYLKDRVTVLAFTATEYALAQKLGYFNFREGSDGQYIAGMTHSNLPNAIFLEESWFGYPVTPALPDHVYWDMDRIIAGGGWGMRLLKANADNVIENDSAYDYEYRVDTDVITSFRIFASDDITPDNRHESQAAYNSPTKNTATVTISANGYTKSTEVVMPSGSAQLVWLKWRTPSTPGDVTVTISITGNSAVTLDGLSRNETLIAKVVDLSLSEPPNPTANDRNDHFTGPSMPVKAEKTTAHWGEYESSWIPKWVRHAKWEWYADWNWITNEDGGYWVDDGNWVDNGKWVDEGHWTFDYTEYAASLSGEMVLVPDVKSPTAKENAMKSGYGVNIHVSTTPTTHAPSSHITRAQNVITYFPEYGYTTYWRALETMGYGDFAFRQNKYSTYNNRVHFSPIWFPDGQYSVYAEVIDAWTPDGMLRIYLNDDVTINGDLYQDWHIGP